MAASSTQIEQFKVADTQRQAERNEESFEARLLKTVGEYYDLTRASRARRYTLWLFAAMFAKAIHWFDYYPYRGTVEEWSEKRIRKCLYTPSGLLQYTVEVIAAQYTNSNSRTVPASPSQDPKTRAVLRGLQNYADYLDWDFYRADPHQRQTEAKLIPLRGVFNLVEYDKTAGPKLMLPVYQEQNETLCADCGMATQGQPDCPGCGSENVASMATGVGNNGQVEGRQGQVKNRTFDPFQVEIYDRRRGVEESKHVICDESLFKTEAKKEYPWLKRIEGEARMGTYQQGFLGLHYLHQLQTVIANTGRLDQSEDLRDGPTRYAGYSSYGGSFLNPLLCWRRRAWLDRDVYEEWLFDDVKWTQLPGSDKLIPPKSRVGDVFPDGMCVHIINGNQVVKVENQNKNDVWSYVAYRVPAEGLHGTGVNSLISMVRGLDEATSFQFQTLVMAALGILVSDARVPNVRNVPGDHIQIPESVLAPGERVTDLVGRIDTGGSAAIAAAEPVKLGMRQMIADNSMTSSPNASGLNREGMRTATGVRYQSGAVNTLTAPPLEAYGAHRAKVIGQAIQLERKNNIRPRLYGKFGKTAARWFDPMTVPEDVRFASAEDSWQPRTIESRKENVSTLLSMQLATQPVIEEAFKAFGITEGVDSYDEWSVKAQKIFDVLKESEEAITREATELVGEVQSPEDAAVLQAAYSAPERLIQMAGAAPRPLDANGHEFYMRFIETELYNSDEWESFSPLLQQTIELWFEAHKNAGMMQAVEAAGADPARAAAQADQQVSAAADSRARSEEESGKQADHERTLTVADRTHKHTITVEKEKRKSAVQLEKLRGQNRNKGAR